MAKKKLKRRPIGISPAALVHVGESKLEKTKIELIRYNANSCQEIWFEQATDIKKSDIVKGSVNWLNVYGLSDITSIEQIGNAFSMNRFLLADLLDTKLRSKTEEQDGHLSISIKAPHWDESIINFETEQISFVMGDDFIICFQEKEGDLFDSIRERIRLGKGTVRQRESGYLLFLLMDVIIDHFLVIIDKTQDILDELQLIINANPREPDFLRTQHVKTELMQIRKAVLPIRESISQLNHAEEKYFSLSTEKLFDHLISNITDCLESVEIQREMIATMSDIYFSRQNGKMNEIIKWLTIMSTIFIPLSFIAGVYGMNFSYMPELSWHYGYPAIISLMVIVVLGLLYFLRRKRWI
jgi:magnesium transporter